MNLLKSHVLLRSVNFLPTRWTGNRCIKSMSFDIKYFSCSECRPISGKSLPAGGTDAEAISLCVRSYSKSHFSKITEYISMKKKDFDRANNRPRSALMLYRTIDTINFQDFYDFLELPDTFYSWFALVELHIWMLLTQIMDSHLSSLKLRNQIIKVMWYDVEERCKNIGWVQPKVLKSQLKELYERFPVTLLAYDEGLLSTDTVLAAALWCKLFEKQCDDPIKLEGLVRYIRHQVQHLSSFELRDFHLVENVQNIWLPFSDHVKAVTAL